jgi:hypothetical protein
MMIYNSNQQSAPFNAPEICEHLKTAPLFRTVSFWHGDGSRIEFFKNSGHTFRTELITNGGHVTMFPTALVQADLDSVLAIRAEGKTLANIGIADLCLEIPAGWAVLTNEGLKMCSIEDAVEQLQSMGYGAGDLGADLDDWIDRHSTVEIYGRLYTPSEVLRAMEPERFDELETACMIEYLTDYGIEDIGEELNGVLWHWQEDDLMLTTVRSSIDAESYRMPCEMPNYIREWEQ